MTPSADTAFDYSKAVRKLVRLGRTIAEIADLTDRQIVELFSAEEDEERVSLPAGDGRPPTKEEERAQLFGFGRVVGMTDEELEAAWRQKYPEG